MLRGRDHAIVLGIIALKSGDKRNSHSSGKKRILPVGFLPASPARIAEDIDVGGPEIQSLHDVAPARTYSLVVLGSGFRADHHGHLVDQRSIKGCGQSNWLRKHGSCSSIRDSVQGLAPP